MKPEATLRDDLLKGLWRDNPVLVQTLGMCPTLAVTNSVANALAMGVATFFVLCGSSVLVSAMRRRIPAQVRISSYILIIATFVTVADMALEALVPALHKALGAFIALIVVNCIILGRQEAFAGKHGVLRSLADATGMGLGFCLSLLVMGAVREALGAGSFLGRPLFGPDYEPWVIMTLPPGGFLTLGCMLLGISASKRRSRAPAAAPAPAAEAAA